MNERRALYLEMACAMAPAFEIDRPDRPVKAWSGDVQPVPLHRARVVLMTGRRAYRQHAHLEDKDYAFRTELRQRWIAAGLARRPLEGRLLVAMTFAGCSVAKDALGRKRSRPEPDTTNLVKAVEDAGNGFLWVDDQQIRVLWTDALLWGENVRPLITVDVWRLNGNGH